MTVFPDDVGMVGGEVARLSRKPDALGGAVEISGDDVPADAPAGQMIASNTVARCS
jgi:hypothetical protein